MFTRRHHCRQDGKIYCSRCSDRRWLIDGVQSRVCEDCYQRLSQAAQEKLQAQQIGQYETNTSASTSDDTIPQNIIRQISNVFVSSSSRSQSRSNSVASSFNSTNMPPMSSSRPGIGLTSNPTTPTDQSAAASAMAQAQKQRESQERLIYHTGSLCPKCSLIEKRGYDQYKPAQLFEQYRGIWLRLQCDIHGPHITLVCKERNFWWRCHSYQESWISGLKNSGLVTAIPPSIHQGIQIDIEDLGRQLHESLKSSTPPVDNMPLSFELQLYANEEFVDDAEIDTRLIAFVKKFPDHGRGSTFILKLQGGLVEKSEIPKLNEKILRIVNMASHAATSNVGATPSTSSIHPILTPALANVRIIVDVTYERLVDLLLLDRSCFLKVRVLPCVRYFLGPGEEQQFIAEMDYLLTLVKCISDLELVLSLSLEPPYPNMMTILEYIKRQKGYIRFVTLSRERSPREILQRLKEEIRMNQSALPMASASSKTSPDLDTYPETTDPYELLEALESGTNGLLRPSDFVPLSIGQIFEPVLQSLSYGSYHINPSPFCGFVATLVTTDKLQSIPITRLFDIEQLYNLLIPIAQKMKYGKEKPSIGIMVAKQIQKAMKSCAYNVEVGNLTHARGE